MIFMQSDIGQVPDKYRTCPDRLSDGHGHPSIEDVRMSGPRKCPTWQPTPDFESTQR